MAPFVRTLALLSTLFLALPVFAGADDERRNRLERLQRLCPQVHLATVYVLDHIQIAPISSCPTVTFDPTYPGLIGPPSDYRMLLQRGAAYYSATDTIYLSPRIALDSIPGLATLINLVVHAHITASSDHEAHRCVNRRHAQAMMIEAQFLEDAGEAGQAEVLRVNADVRGSCRTRPDELR
ncbi:MAG: hypothetical protein AAFV62_04820 [Pseudomonadota bacterium]